MDPNPKLDLNNLGRRFDDHDTKWQRRFGNSTAIVLLATLPLKRAWTLWRLSMLAWKSLCIEHAITSVTIQSTVYCDKF